MWGRVFTGVTVLCLKYAGNGSLYFTGRLVAATVFFLCIACQEEIEEMIGEDPGLAIADGSEMTVWIRKATSNYETEDDFLDGYSCGTLKLPIAVSLNGAVRMINNEGDLGIVRDIVEELGIPASLQFPFSVVSGDYTEIEIRSEEELSLLRERCDNDEYARIPCIRFSYPLEMLTYNANNQTNGSVPIGNDQDFFRFMEAIGDLHTTINYPVTVNLGNEMMEVNNNEELLDVIKQTAEGCGN
ncbi:hypothetical protein [Sinomicrobium soli]|uniref:hypothetical protein n=1 Tax=Sinomicrobium sp. N-1-3-6 TaxID=2219864 RepID=UPI000DCB74AC|nr:hypothetical protein [Sinomicrobium sp. N-1-3-6]RAV30781.1 hypothetical protein DN748_00535 [Sinomicrobium sp. N-1-3-6]